MGGGPRGLATLERLVENARQETGLRVEIVMFDDCFPGAGRVWRPTQNRHLLMNTVLSQISMFTDSTVDCDGPIVPGPSMLDWIADGDAALVLAGDSPMLQEINTLLPDDYPSRALYGHYLVWVRDRLTSAAPPNVTLRIRNERVVAVDPLPEDRWQVRTAVAALTADSVVLTLGHLGCRDRGTESELRSFAQQHRLTYIPPANPADVDVSSLRAGETVVIRGLGLCFFDYLALFTTARGGRFIRNGDRLDYLPSGLEPRIVAGCRRGVPHHARGINQKGINARHTPVFLTAGVVAELRSKAVRSGGLDFMCDVWPLIRAEVEYAYAIARLSERGAPDSTALESIRSALLLPTREKTLLLKEVGLTSDDMFPWVKVVNPAYGAPVGSSAEYQAWLSAYLNRDVEQAYGGNIDDPTKSAIDVLRDIRNEVRLIIDHGIVGAYSYREHISRWYTPMNAFLSIGPPVQRIEEMEALLRAEVLTIVGPDMRISPSSDGFFIAHSPNIADSRYASAALIEARLPEWRLEATDDELLRHLINNGSVRMHELDQGFARYRTGSIDITMRPYHVISSKGDVSRTMFAFGIPTEGVHWATAAGIRPGVGSVILADADAVARAALSLSIEPRVENDPDGVFTIDESTVVGRTAAS
ncbi:FAD/NAD(P)-binding protein [Nocardia brasiliensis]|uniref:FAD/NAD(P)-binding protein n=1 Tax=Nocardia brasiliensis TaxID=37326 RepID=UPI002458C532|nr:FAD/NAD(P)-binding protein [Nocardia brasiliensis]